MRPRSRTRDLGQVEGAPHHVVELLGVHARDGDAVVIAEVDHLIAMRVGGGCRLKLRHRRDVGEVREIDGVAARRIEVDDGVALGSGRARCV